MTTAVGAVPQFATDHVDALIVPPADVNAMVDRLEELFTDRTLRDQLSRAGLRTAQKFSLSRVAPLFERALQRAYAHAAA